VEPSRRNWTVKQLDALATPPDTSVFIIPRDFVKNGLERYVVLNQIPRSVIESCRGEHPEFVFTRDGKPVAGINNSGWKAARRRAAKRYAEQFNRPCPPDSDPSGYMTSSTRMGTDCVPLESASRIASSSLATIRIT
jgi:hypothetical protein